jgi:quinol monooxygenase YgiN
MSVALVFNAADCTAAQYDEVQKQLHPEKKTPAGMLFHVAGPADGGWRVIEVWASQEAAEAYFRNTLGAVLQKANINPGRPDVFPVHSTMTP